MSWETVSAELLASKSVFDEWKLSIPGNEDILPIPGIIKLTLKLMDKAMAQGMNKLIVVYPERTYLPSMTVILRTISDIISGKIETTYDLRLFQPGQKLKISNCVCEFVSIENRNGRDMIKVKFAHDDFCLYPMEKAPFFQQTDTRRSLSVSKRSHINNGGIASVFDTLEAKKTFLKDSIYYVASARKFKDTFCDIKIDNKNILELILLGAIGNDKDINILNKGQIDGIPALIFSNDLYPLTGHPPENTRCIFIDIHNDSIINSQLDALDEIISRENSVVVVSDTANSFNFKSMEERGFLTLRWDSESIVPGLYNTVSSDIITKKIYNCGNGEVHYEQCENTEITYIMKTLNKLRHDMEGATQILTDLYWKLRDISIILLRNTIILPRITKRSISERIDSVEAELNSQKYSISSESIGCLKNIIDTIRNILDENYIFEKVRKTEFLIANSVFGNIVMIISENEDKNVYTAYWKNHLQNSNSGKTIKIMYVQEYYDRTENVDAEVIVCGWMGKKKMRNIIFSNNAPLMHILLNKIEMYWKKSHFSEWNSVIRNESRSLFDKNMTSLVYRNTEQDETTREEADEDIDDIEKSIQENKFKKYCSQNTKNLTVEAVPIIFVSGYLSFYKKSSKVITVSDIINNISENSREIIKLAAEIETGDFVVIREKERSLIHELADDILEKEGKKEYRDLSGRWKNGLNKKCAFCSVRELHDMIVRAGSSIGLQAFRTWIDDDDFIAPQDKENLRYIAVALKDKELINNIDEIFEICKYVKAAHVKAGNEISRRLRNSIARVLGDMPGIKRSDIWDPIDIQLEGLGKVKILRVTDIGNVIPVDIIHTNKLLTEAPQERYLIEGKTIFEVFSDYLLGKDECRARGFIPDENKIYRRTC